MIENISAGVLVGVVVLTPYIVAIALFYELKDRKPPRGGLIEKIGGTMRRRELKVPKINDDQALWRKEQDIKFKNQANDL